AIVGAGLSGLACARALRDAGFEPQLFEKSRGVAGRMSTRRGEGWQCDHGAQYFTARDPAFRAEVGRWLDAGVAQRWQPRLRAFGPGGAVRVPDESLERFVGVPGMTAPARRLAEGLPVRTDCTVDALARGAEGWRLRCAERGWIDEPFAAVLLAVPAPQAAALLAGAATQAPAHAGAGPGGGSLAARAGSVAQDTIVPAAAALEAIARSARMRACWALMLRYPAPLALDFDAAFVNEGPLRWVARDASKPGRAGPETWLLHAEAEWSERHVEEPPERVVPTLVDAFVRLGGAAPAAWTAHRWRYADTAQPLEAACAWNSEAGLGLCGDWLAGGKVEGAWRSGRALARAVAAASPAAP
ncbi:MAG TPA: FAD-dependent oxidoreductase, partial [Quisquiliibacterium sp.]|nr:FAD-dependent oxidoreductase [Quisquiliibacterium sp.]